MVTSLSKAVSLAKLNGNPICDFYVKLLTEEQKTDKPQVKHTLLGGR